jgi:urea transport system substrate-binding protein
VEQFGKKVFFVGSNYVWPKESNKNAKIWLQKAGGELLGEEYIPLGGSEFGPVLNKIRDAKPNFIFSTVVGASDIAFHKQFKQEGFKADTMPIASLTTGEIETRAMGNEFGAGHFLSAPYFQGLDNPTNQEQIRQERNDALQHGGDIYFRLCIQVRPRKGHQGGWRRSRDATCDPRPFRWSAR